MGLFFILCWFWWCISVYFEIVVMVILFLVVIYFEFIYLVDLLDYVKFVYGVGIIMVGWLIIIFMICFMVKEILICFYCLICFYFLGWDVVIQYVKKVEELVVFIFISLFMLELSCMFVGCFMVYGLLFSMGYLFYGELVMVGISLLVVLVFGWVIYCNWFKIQQQSCKGNQMIFIGEIFLMSN